VWIKATPAAGHRLRRQGWKLHVSAGPQARDVLNRCLRVLAKERVHFKVLASDKLLIDLSCGNGGLSQVGKFITVYPDSSTNALRLAQALDAATEGGQGPAIVSDLPLRRGSLVHYRYAAFRDHTIMTPLGEVEPAILSPRGTWVPARARQYYEQPSWVDTPFTPATQPDSPGQSSPIAGRFVPVQILDRCARGRTLLAIDTHRPRRCVVKEALPWVVLGRDGSDARTRLAHEASILASLASSRVAPRSFGYFADGDVRYLSMEDIAGATLAQQVSSAIIRNGPPDGRRLARLAIHLSSALGRLHRAGFVHRDLKPENVIWDGHRYRFIDFELTLPVNAKAAWGIGSRGYMSPEQRTGGVASMADDVYSLGCLIAFAATGADLAAVPRRWTTYAPPVELLNPSLPSSLIAILRACLDRNAARRPRNGARVLARFTSWLKRVTPAPTRTRSNARLRRSSSARPSARHDLSSAVRRLSSLLHDDLAAWTVAPSKRLFLNDGVSGAVLVLSEIARVAPKPRTLDLLRRSARRLLQASGDPQRHRLPGLCVGDAGIAAAVLRAAVVCSDDGMVTEARRLAVTTLRHSPESPDFFHGAAGRLWLGLQLMERWPSSAVRGLNEDLADDLVRRVGQRSGRWRIPDGYSGLSGQAYWGFAHGIAGIGSVLVACHRIQPSERASLAAVRAARHLRGAAIVTLRGRGLTWPVSDCDESLPGPFWCHGPAGVGAFFLDLWREARDPSTLAVVEAAAHSVVESGRWLGISQCHGLAGSVDYLLDCEHAIGSGRWGIAARELGVLLAQRASANSRAELSTSGLGLFTGYPGALLALMRLSHPDPSHRLLGPGFMGPFKSLPAPPTGRRR
jgi:serine/threonine protein kinase